MPNPINHNSAVRFVLPYAGHATLKVYNVVGQEVTALVNEELQAGTHSVVFDAQGLPSSIYFLRFEFGSDEVTKKLILLK